MSLPKFAYFSEARNWKYAEVKPPRISNTPEMTLISHHRSNISAPLKLSTPSYISNTEGNVAYWPLADQLV